MPCHSERSEESKAAKTRGGRMHGFFAALRMTKGWVFVAAMALAVTSCTTALKPVVEKIAPKPLFRDPVYDGAADPSIIYDRAGKKWLMFYTNRRANVPDLTAVTWVHGTPIGIAESLDG